MMSNDTTFSGNNQPGSPVAVLHALAGAGQNSGNAINVDVNIKTVAHENENNCDQFSLTKLFCKTSYKNEQQIGGKSIVKQMFDANDINALLKPLLDSSDLHGECLAVTGRTLSENLENVTFGTDQDVIYPVSNPITSTGVVKGFISDRAGSFCINQAGPEVAFGGPLKLVRDEDMILVSAVSGELYLKLGSEELEEHRKNRMPSTQDDQSGKLWKYSKQAGSMQTGALVHSEGKKEVVCYADI